MPPDRRPKTPPPPVNVGTGFGVRLPPPVNVGTGFGVTGPKTSSTYTPWTGGGDSRFITAPGDSTIEYGVGRTSTGTRSVPNVQAPAPSTAAGPLNWRDSAYNAQIAAIQRALQDFETGAQTRGERYGQDFTTGLNRLGYRPGEGFQAMPNILEMFGEGRTLAPGESASSVVSLPSTQGGMFDIEGVYDPYSAAAQGTRGTRDEFAGRGTLRSSDFAKSFGDFQNRLNQQLEAMETGRTRFGEDLVTDVSRERSATQDRLQAAQRDAMMRAAIAAAGGASF